MHNVEAIYDYINLLHIIHSFDIIHREPQIRSFVRHQFLHHQ